MMLTDSPEGVLTSFLGVVAYLYLPHNAATPKKFFGFSVNLFTPRQGSILVTRVMRNDPTKALRYGKPLLPSHIVETFMDWRLYGHLVAALLSMVMIAPMNTYAPSIIQSLGFSGLQANGLNSVGSVCALIWTISLAFSSDKTRERGFHIAAGYLWGAIGLLWLALTPDSAGKRVLYGKTPSTSKRKKSKLRQESYALTSFLNRRCRVDADGHGLWPGHQCRLVDVQDGGPQATHCSGCVRHEPAACQLPR